MVFILLTGLSACAGKSVHTDSMDANEVSRAAASEGKSWWYCLFRIYWPDNTDVDMSADLMLAHAVVKPVLDNYRPKIDYWRFHRRAIRDEAGHQFSFIFYTDPATAAAIMRDLKKSDVLQRAVSGNIVEKIEFDDTGNPLRPKLEDASDKTWPLEIQRNWPAYIMGASSAWLGLIDDLMSGTPATGDIHQLLEQYRKANAAITTLWTNNGQHAFIHHLSAIFGYEPLTIKQQISF